MATAPVTEEHDVVPGGTGAVVETAAEHDVFPPFDVTTFSSQLFWLTVTFVLLYWVLAKVAIPRLSGIVEARAGKIAGDLEAAEQAQTTSEAAREAYEKALAEARGRGFAIAEEARNTAKAAADADRKGIETSLAAKLADAESRISGIKTQALAEVGTIANEAAEAIVKALGGTDVARPEVERAVADSLAGRRQDAV
jgi:F-type H+-transporting ATPase subunit b